MSLKVTSTVDDLDINLPTGEFTRGLQGMGKAGGNKQLVVEQEERSS